MAGFFSASMVVAGVVSQSGGAGAVSSPPVYSASASLSQSAGFLIQGTDPSASTVVRGNGSVSLDVKDRVRGAAALSGDSGSFFAQLSAGGTAYSISVARVGMPANLNPGPIYGGVLLDRDVFGSTGMGPWYFPVSHAAVALYGVGEVRIDGKVVTSQARVQVFALSAGFHTDDSDFRPLANAREGDTELMVLATDLPAGAGASFLEFGFDGVRIEVAGQSVASVDRIPVTGAGIANNSGVGGSGLVNAGLFHAVLPTDAMAPVSAAEASPALMSQRESATGIPGSPAVSNNGSQSSPFAQTPAPLNASDATALTQGTTPLNANPVGTQQIQSPAPLNTATSAPSSPAPLNGSPALPGISTPSFAPGIAPLNSAPVNSATALPGNSPVSSGR